MNDDFDNAVLKWIRMIKDKNLPVCSPITQQKVLDFAKEFVVSHA